MDAGFFPNAKTGKFMNIIYQFLHMQNNGWWLFKNISL